MDNSLTNVHKRKPSNKAKSKKKPVKVVYISNPMKVKTSASQFRALVQELTGQDAGFPDPTKFTDTDHDVGSNRTVQDDEDAAKLAADNHHHPRALEIPEVDASHQQPEISDFLFEPFDDIFMPQTSQILENNISGLGLFPSSLCCESSQVDVVRSLDAM
ncbi:sigma factor binding protein 1, chloroplastic-like [Melia azedarach]|uniref:Sigma factor binding protein 1, chloroplastic-like n=1 Tax=Melia azedarach TaxID=155640 RepID=A0ACC1X476_MELAZ|nr:sigma factor binding protein 1, chloroplastic-like [Melia azedarach]